MGLAGFYRKFIPNFSEIAAPLTDLTKKDRPNRIKDWLSHHKRAFQTLKSRLTSSPILRLPVFNEVKPFKLRSDASVIGIGAVLLQEFEGEGKLPIAYASKKLLPRCNGQFFPQSVFSPGKEWAGPFFPRGKN